MVEGIFDINAPLRDEAGKARPTAKLANPAMNQFGMSTSLLRDASEYSRAMSLSFGDGGKPQTGLEIAAKALGIQVPQAYAYANFSFMPDAQNYGLMQWPGVNPESLSKVCRENVGPQLVIRQRTADLARYADLSTHAWKPGWRISMRDASQTPSTADRLHIRAAQRFVANCSRDYDYADARERDAALLSPFGLFLRLFVNDIHTYDGWAIWTSMDRRKGVERFANLPAGLIRLGMPGKGVNGDPRVFAALVDETGNPAQLFTRDELTWRVMNPRTDPATMGYGWPIPEMAMRLIQALQSGIDLNADQFTRNSIPNGMLLAKGDFFNTEQLDALGREWTNMKKGVSKLWGMPIMSIPEDGDVTLLDFMDLKGQDVRFKDHMNMMVGFMCSLWRFPIRRLGMFASGNRRDNQPLPDESVETQGVDDPGLPELLSFIEETLNQYLIWSNWPQLQFEFLNKNPKEDARSYAERTKARTWKESRAEADLPKLTSVASADMKPVAEVLELCPEDPAKIAAFQTVAVEMLKAKLGTADAKDSESPGAPFPSLKDPAKTQEHGHRVGVRRSSKREETAAQT